MEAVKKEIRRILHGHFTYETYENDEMLIVATQNPLKIQTSGMFFGIDSIRVLGMGVRSRTYQVRGEAQETQDICVRNMLLRGQQIILQSSPNTLAVLHFPITANPSVLTLDDVGDQYLLRVYTARSPLAWRYAARIFEKWEYDTAAYLSATESADPPKTGDTHAAEKKRKDGGENRTDSLKRGDTHAVEKKRKDGGKNRTGSMKRGGAHVAVKKRKIGGKSSRE